VFGGESGSPAEPNSEAHRKPHFAITDLREDCSTRFNRFRVFTQLAPLLRNNQQSGRRAAMRALESLGYSYRNNG